MDSFGKPLRQGQGRPARRDGGGLAPPEKEPSSPEWLPLLGHSAGHLQPHESASYRTNPSYFIAGAIWEMVQESVRLDDWMGRNEYQISTRSDGSN